MLLMSKSATAGTGIAGGIGVLIAALIVGLTGKNPSDNTNTPSTAATPNVGHPADSNQPGNQAPVRMSITTYDGLIEELRALSITAESVTVEQVERVFTGQTDRVVGLLKTRTPESAKALREFLDDQRRMLEGLVYDLKQRKEPLDRATSYRTQNGTIRFELRDGQLKIVLSR